MEGDLYEGMDGFDDDPTRYADQDMYDQQPGTPRAAGAPEDDYQQQEYQQHGDYQQHWDAGGSPQGAGVQQEEEQFAGHHGEEAGPGPGSGHMVEAYRRAMVEWRDAFKQVAAVLGCAGLTSGNSGEPDVVGVMGVLRELKAAHETAQEDLAGVRRGLAEAQVALAGAVLENSELRREAAAGWMAAEPAVVQVRGLVLDPAVAREFEGLRRSCEEKSRLVLGLKEEAEGLAFTQESKVGRALVAKCRTLQEENEDLGRQLAAAQAGAGAGGAGDTLLSLEKEHAAVLRQHWSELRALAGHLEAENQDLHRALLLAERELAELRGSGGREGGGGGGGPRGGGGGAGVDNRGRGPRGGGPSGPPGGGRGGGYGGRGGGMPMGGRGRRGGGGGGGGGGGVGGGGAGRYTGHKRMR